MKKCVKCGTNINSPFSYCPKCGTLLPGEQAKVLIPSAEYKRLMEGVGSEVPAGMLSYDRKEYEDAITFYNKHKQTGYAPAGKTLISQLVYDLLKKANEEFEANKTRYGMLKVCKNLGGKVALVDFPRYGVTQRTETRHVDVNFEDFWEARYTALDTWKQIAVQVLFWCLVLLCALFTLVLLAANGWMLCWGLLLLISGGAFVAFVCVSIFGYDD